MSLVPLVSSPVHDLVVVGSGPAGYTAAVYAARAGLAPVVYESSVELGGALMQTTEVENFPGFPDGVMGPDLMMLMRSQAERFGAVLVPDDVVSVDLTGELKSVSTTTGSVLARTVVLAMGSAYRRLGVPGEDALSGRGVSWCATCDGAFFRDKEVVVVGGGDSAMEEASFLSRMVSKVTIIHRRETLRASRIMQDRVRDNAKVELLLGSTVDEFVGDGRLEGVRVRVGGEPRLLPASGAFVAVGHEPRSVLVRGQVDLDEQGYVLTRGHSSSTNVPGVFACGDLVDHTYRQAITAAGSGCMAALDAERYLSGLPQGTPVDQD